MPQNRHVVLFHAPQSRSSGARILLEELSADFELRVLNIKANEQRGPAYLAVNPMGKVPAILHGDALITEQAAVFMYLTDLYPEAKLAPPIGDVMRGPYLRWMVFYGSCFEPAVVDRSMQREPAAQATSPYGNFDTVLRTLSQQLLKGPYILGEKFSAADVLWATALTWTTGFQLVPLLPEIKAYIDFVNTRPHFLKIREQDAALAASITS
jgi:glutathione S-transferase